MSYIIPYFLFNSRQFLVPVPGTKKLKNIFEITACFSFSELLKGGISIRARLQLDSFDRKSVNSVTEYKISQYYSFRFYWNVEIVKIEQIFKIVTAYIVAASSNC